VSTYSGQDETEAAGSWLRNYTAAPGLFDELEEAPSRPRQHWRPFIQSLERLGRQELQSRWDNGRRIILEHGVTYNLYGDPEGTDRAWDLDFVPLLITAQEWEHIEAGLIQRSHLFNLILADLYGGFQHLLRAGFLPPELVYSNPAFLRPCRGVHTPGQVYLHFHACDLGRSPDGQWWVLADRTQSPSGAGYAWENRTVVSRVLPEQMRDCRVERLAGFFQQQREMLVRLAPPGRHPPSIVLMTPGPYNETYFEHAYLARNLGFPLVEGADLTVRDRRVYLKTIEGLQPVDVILRRVEDSYCDPLELRGESLLGVSGLVEAARAGNVTVANALGAGLMESPAFLAFLPGLCRHLLGTDLLLPSIATWWCGQADALRYVTEHIDSLVVNPAFGGRVFSAQKSGASKGRRKLQELRAELIEKIQAAPREFVGQERVKLSRAPTWVENKLVSRPVILRAYVANGGNSVAVLPGGLARVSRTPGDLYALKQNTSSAKDTWILSNGIVASPEPAQDIAESQPAVLLASGVPSRSADHLFWLGRYTERLEQLLRVLRCVLGRISAEPGAESAESAALAELMVHLGLIPRGPESSVRAGELTDRILSLLYNADEPGGMRELSRRVRSIASSVRDRFSGDTWRILGRLDSDARTKQGRLPIAHATALSHRLVLDLAAFNGMEMENMTRGSGWRFLDFGRRLERAFSMLKLLQAASKISAPVSTVLEPVLEIADSLMTYRRQHFAAPVLAGVLALIVRDDSNPRSVAFQVRLMIEHSEAVAASAGAARGGLEQERLQALAGALDSEDLPGMAGTHATGDAKLLPDILGGWASHLAAVSDAVTSRYFSHSIPRIS
jgi:uncharacterized circularly permuted ATP-grasp superfamily protein/uncharacterized alpha-E superfamily protein